MAAQRSPAARAYSVMRALGVALLLAVALGGTASGARAHSKATPVVFGAGGWAFPSAHQLHRLARHGLRSWRLTISWSDVSPRPGVTDLGGYDDLLRAASRYRIQILATLTGCPRWACPAGGPPTSPAALAGFEQFVHTLVARYGHHGTLWGRHRHVPVTYWQVFNEVNGADQWPHPSPAAYAAVLKRTAATIRSTDRRAKVVLAGLGEKMTIWLRSYLPALYRRPGFKRDFDVMAPEGYAVHTRDVARILTTTRRIMRRFHDSKTPMFVTEMGWSTGGPAFPFTTSPAGQAARLRVSWRLLDACRAHWRLRRVYWFAYADQTAFSIPDYWGFHNGLVDLTARPKPAWHSFLRYLRPKTAAQHAGRCRMR